MGYRKLTLNDTTWQYVVGKSTVKFKPPSGKSFVVSSAKILGLSEDDYERARWKNRGEAWMGITPKMLVEYLTCNRHLR